VGGGGEIRVVLGLVVRFGVDGSNVISVDEDYETVGYVRHGMFGRKTETITQARGRRWRLSRQDSSRIFDCGFSTEADVYCGALLCSSSLAVPWTHISRPSSVKIEQIYNVIFTHYYYTLSLDSGDHKSN
jgi:hypothetical protein